MVQNRISLSHLFIIQVPFAPKSHGPCGVGDQLRSTSCFFCFPLSFFFQAHGGRPSPTHHISFQVLRYSVIYFGRGSTSGAGLLRPPFPHAALTSTLCFLPLPPPVNAAGGCRGQGKESETDAFMNIPEHSISRFSSQRKLGTARDIILAFHFFFLSIPLYPIITYLLYSLFVSLLASSSESCRLLTCKHAGSWLDSETCLRLPPRNYPSLDQPGVSNYARRLQKFHSITSFPSWPGSSSASCQTP